MAQVNLGRVVGYSAYEVAVQEGFVGTEQEWLASLKGDTGNTGPTGADGADGATFTPSVSAEGIISWTNDGGKVNPPSVNIKGPQGIQGPAGPAGTYTEGTGIDIDNGVLSVDTTVVALKSDLGDELPPITSGDAGKILKVNSLETGVEWGAESGGTTYTAGDGIVIEKDEIELDPVYDTGARMNNDVVYLESSEGTIDGMDVYNEEAEYLETNFEEGVEYILTMDNGVSSDDYGITLTQGEEGRENYWSVDNVEEIDPNIGNFEFDTTGGSWAIEYIAPPSFSELRISLYKAGEILTIIPELIPVDNETIVVNNDGLLEAVVEEELPAISSGDAGKALVVNSLEDGVEWATVGGSSTAALRVINSTAQSSDSIFSGISSADKEYISNAFANGFENYPFSIKYRDRVYNYSTKYNNYIYLIALEHNAYASWSTNANLQLLHGSRLMRLGFVNNVFSSVLENSYELTGENVIVSTSLNSSVANIIQCPTTTDGTFVLQCVVSSGSPTYSWVSLPAANGQSF